MPTAASSTLQIAGATDVPIMHEVVYTCRRQLCKHGFLMATYCTQVYITYLTDIICYCSQSLNLINTQVNILHVSSCWCNSLTYNILNSTSLWLAFNNKQSINQSIRTWSFLLNLWNDSFKKSFKCGHVVKSVKCAMIDSIVVVVVQM